MTDDLEQAFRDGLRRAGDRADTAVPLAEQARASAARRRRNRWAIVGAAAATVVAVAGATTAIRLGSDAPDRRTDDVATTTPSVAVTEWRAESWRNLTVDVPADWGWGTAPFDVGAGIGDALCGGPGPMVTADGRKLVNPKRDLPWVGRPVMLSDLCASTTDPPEAPYVWLGAEVEVGTVDLGDGWTQETVEAFGATLTVGSDDASLSRQILDSARATTGCEAQLTERPSVFAIPIEGLDPVKSAQICAYTKGADDGYDLTYMATLDRDTAQGLYGGDAVDGKAAREFCAEGGAEYVRVTFTGRDAMGTADLTSEAVIDPVCGQIEFGPGLVLPLTDDGMSLWSHNGSQAVLRALIGMLG